MSWLEAIRRSFRSRVHDEPREDSPPLPTTSTIFGMATVMTVIWLMASGLPHLLTASDQSPCNNIEAGASK
jgi:hypothetical protein